MGKIAISLLLVLCVIYVTSLVAQGQENSTYGPTLNDCDGIAMVLQQADEHRAAKRYLAWGGVNRRPPIGFHALLTPRVYHPEPVPAVVRVAWREQGVEYCVPFRHQPEEERMLASIPTRFSFEKGGHWPDKGVFWLIVRDEKGKPTCMRDWQWTQSISLPIQ